MKNSRPTVDSVKDGLAKMIREVRNLQTEVSTLTATIKGFTRKHPLPYQWEVVPPSSGGENSAAQFKTDEPRSQIEHLRYEFSESTNLDVPTRTLLVIARELDGALRDIRAARMEIKGISDDSALRSEFAEWQKSNKTN